MTDNERFIRELYVPAEAKTLDTQKFVSLFSDDGYMQDMPSGIKFRGDAIGESIGGLAAAFPDVHREIVDLYVAEDVVIVELRIQGTHKGELKVANQTFAPTGKKIDAPCCDIFHVKDGKVVAFNCYNYPSVMLAQLGLTGD